MLKWWISHAVCLFICIIRFRGKSILDWVKFLPAYDNANLLYSAENCKLRTCDFGGMSFKGSLVIAAWRDAAKIVFEHCFFPCYTCQFFVCVGRRVSLWIDVYPFVHDHVNVIVLARKWKHKYRRFWVAFVDVEDLTEVGRTVSVANAGAFGCENCGLCGSAMLFSGERNMAAMH